MSPDSVKIDRTQTVANLVLEHSECAEVFQRHRIDFCCRGELTVQAAAESKKINVDVLVDELAHAVTARQGEQAPDLRSLSTLQLISHIVSRHHSYLRKALPFVQGLASKVGRVHGDHNPKLRELDVAVEALSAALLPHLDAEEQSLFPMLCAVPLDKGAAATHFTTMTEDHHDVALLLERVRAAADDFALPAWACNSYRTLFAELEALESDVFTHVHLENHVLRPRFAVS